MSSVIAARGIGIEQQKMSTTAAVMRVTSILEGAFSNDSLLEHGSRRLSKRRPSMSPHSVFR